MVEKEIEVIINPDGSTSIEALHFEGKACEDTTRELEKVLGETVSDVKKREYYSIQRTQAKQRA